MGTPCLPVSGRVRREGLRRQTARPIGGVANFVEGRHQFGACPYAVEQTEVAVGDDLFNSARPVHGGLRRRGPSGW